MIKIRLDEIYHDGGGAPDDALLIITNEGLLGRHVFRAGEVYDVRTSKMKTITEAYKMGTVDSGTVNLRPVKNKGRLELLTSFILEKK